MRTENKNNNIVTGGASFFFLVFGLIVLVGSTHSLESDSVERLSKAKSDFEIERVYDEIEREPAVKCLPGRYSRGEITKGRFPNKRWKFLIGTSLWKFV